MVCVAFMAAKTFSWVNSESRSKVIFAIIGGKNTLYSISKHLKIYPTNVEQHLDFFVKSKIIIKAKKEGKRGKLEYQINWVNLANACLDEDVANMKAEMKENPPNTNDRSFWDNRSDCLKNLQEIRKNQDFAEFVKALFTVMVGHQYYAECRTVRRVFDMIYDPAYNGHFSENKRYKFLEPLRFVKVVNSSQEAIFRFTDLNFKP